MNKHYTLILICSTVCFLFADQNLLAPNLSLIAEEFGFSKEERDELLGGRIALGFFLIGGFVSLFAGFLADTMNRCICYILLQNFGCNTF